MILKLIDLINTINDNKYNAGKIGESSYARHKETIKIISSSPISELDIENISQEQLRNFLNSLIYNYSDSVISKVYMHLRKAFKLALKRGYITKNLMDDTEDLPKPCSRKPKRKVESLTIDEHRNLINVLLNEEVTHKYKNIILLMLYTGMRVGETLAINYKRDIDFTTNELRICRTLTRVKGDIYVLGNKTKTYSSTRNFPITPVVSRLLRDSIFRCKGNSEDLLFWDYKNDTVINPGEINHYLKRIAKKYKICPKIHNHMLRHTYATRCIESGMPAVVLQKKLGHKDISVTLNTYTSVFSKFEDKKDEDFMEYLVANSLMI